MRRTEHIRLRLKPAAEGTPIEIVLSKQERSALEKAIETTGYQRGLSTFLRECAVRAARDYRQPDSSPADVIEAAASAACQGVGEWIRTVALAAVGESDLLSQLEHARADFERGPATWEG